MVIKITGGNSTLFSGSLDSASVSTIVGYAKGKDGNIKDYEDVINIVCEYYNLTKEDVMSRCRIMELTTARALIYYRLVVTLGYTRGEVGKLFGKTHATVINGIKAARNYYHVAYKNIFKEDIK